MTYVKRVEGRLSTAYGLRGFVAILALMTLSIVAFAQTTAAGPESWTSAWKPGHGCGVSREKPHSDGVSLKQTLPDDFTRGHYQWSQELATQAGATYEFRCFYRHGEIKDAFVQFHFRYPGGEPMPFQDFRFSTRHLKGMQEEWTELVHEVKAPANSASVEIGLRLNSPGSIYWSRPAFRMKKPPINSQFDEKSHAYDFTESVGIVRLWEPDRIAGLHIRWVRHNVLWSQAEKSGPGQWDEAYLARAEAQVRAAHGKGLKVLLSLGYPPRWAARQSKDIPGGNVVARDLKDWQQFVAIVVGRTKAYVDTYRIMNEVNHQWDTGAQPAEYAEFLKTGYRVIKAIAPQATVVMAGVSGTPGGYLQGIYDAGGGKAMDVVACQSYIHGHRSPEEGNLVARLQAYRMVMVSNNDMRPIWITEFGYPTVPLSTITPVQQAAYCVRSHLLALSSGAGVTKFFYYLMQDSDGDTITQTGGLFDRQWKIKPLGTAVGTLAELTNPVTAYAGIVPVSSDPAVYSRLFRTMNHQHVWALWRTAGTQTVTLRFANSVTYVSWDGKRSAPGREMSVDIGENPGFIIGDLSDKEALARKPAAFGFESLAVSQRNATSLPWCMAAPTMEDWRKAPELRLTGKRIASSGVMARARVLGSPTGIHVRMDIDDSSPAKNMAKGFSGVWAQDAVELFVNRNAENAPAGFITRDCYQFIITPGQQGDNARVYLATRGSTSLQKPLTEATITVTIRPDRSGYIMEFLIPWKDWTEKPVAVGDALGFDILATVANDKGDRVETGAWFGDLEDSADASLWGVVRFEK